jgi:flagellar biogenesis protein FliO
MRVFSWLQARTTRRATKQLQVSEVVSLGEKRFVAIIQVENRKFLIGGGASSVALLTHLDAGTESIGVPVASIPVPEPLPRLRGVY